MSFRGQRYINRPVDILSPPWLDAYESLTHRRAYQRSLGLHAFSLSTTCVKEYGTVLSLPPNGEVEGPRAGARLEPRVHTVFQHPRRHYRASRTPPTIVRSRPKNIAINCHRTRFFHRTTHRLAPDSEQAGWPWQAYCSV